MAQISGLISVKEDMRFMKYAGKYLTRKTISYKHHNFDGAPFSNLFLQLLNALKDATSAQF